MSVPSEPVFPWVFPLPQPPSGCVCLGDCLEEPTKKCVSVSSLYDCVCSEMHSLYALNFSKSYNAVAKLP